LKIINIIEKMKILLTLIASQFLTGCGVFLSSGYEPIANSVALREASRAELFEEKPPLAILKITYALTEAMKRGRLSEESKSIEQAAALAQVSKKLAYKINAGDVLQITVKSALDAEASTAFLSAPPGAQLSSGPGGSYTVQVDGSVSLALIGRVALAGLTEVEAAARLEDVFKRYIKAPWVELRVGAHRSAKVFISGDFRRPGAQNLTDVHSSLQDVISKAEGLVSQNDKYKFVLRREARLYNLDLGLLNKVGFNLDSIQLRDGDALHASKSENRVGVMGETGPARFVQIKENGLTLNEALIEVGGVNISTANTRQIYVIRQTESINPGVFHFSAKSALDLSVAENFLMQPRDIIYVDAVPLARWNRIISLILPATQPIASARALSQ
jgi:polysaccharide biosynthesis/export protein